MGKLKGASASQVLPANFLQATGSAKPDESADAIARNNVTARLLNAKLVKQELAHVLKGISEVLGLASEAKKTGGDTSVEVLAVDDGVDTAVLEADGPELDGFDEQTSAVRQRSPAATDDEDDDDYRRFDRRIASSDDDDDDDDDDDKDEAVHPFPAAASTNRRNVTYDPADDLSLSSSPPASPSPPPKTPHPPKKAPTTTPGSTFLPSLTMGGYWSGSDSSPEKDGALDVAPRKNRRGQRARRQIWEQKFGQKANHIKKEARDQGWDAKRGATGDGGRRVAGVGARAGRVPNRGESRGHARKATGANMIDTAPRAQPRLDQKAREKAEMDKKPIHPSWAAAKKVKEAKKGAVFAGKKVVFD